MIAPEVPGVREEAEDGPLYSGYVPGKNHPVTLRLIPLLRVGEPGRG